MPPYTERVMSEQQIADIYVHVKTFPLPPDPATIPILHCSVFYERQLISATSWPSEAQDQTTLIWRRSAST